MLVKLGIDVKFYLSVSRFKTGYSFTILLHPSYHIKIGSGFPTMQLVELAPFSNGARFLRYSLLEFLSLSLSHCIHHQPSFGGLNVCSFLYLHVQVQQQNYL
jgi:hypothetical protein